MPEVIVKSRQDLIPATMKKEFAGILQDAVAQELSVPGTQAELRRDEVEVDFAEFSPFAATNGIDCAIAVEANLYPERAGKEQEYSDRLGEWLCGLFPVRGARCYIWVRLAPGGFTEFRT